MNISKNTTQPGTQNDAIDLRQLFRVLWAGKWLIGGITFITTAIAVIIALMLPNLYRAEALLAPNDQESASGLSALAAQYGGLASLAGIDLNGGDADKIVFGLEVLQSRQFISGFIERHDILVPLMAADGWDAATGGLAIDADYYNVTELIWVRDVSPPKKQVPSMQEAYREFMKILAVKQDKKTGFVKVSVEFYSPTIAKQWVDWLVEDLNAFMVQQDVTEAEQAIEYLNEQITNTSLAELQVVFFRLIEEQTKTVMLARVSNEYLLKTLDPAIAPELKSKPKRSLIVFLAALLGGFFGIVIHLIRSSNANHRLQSSSS